MTTAGRVLVLGLLLPALVGSPAGAAAQSNGDPLELWEAFPMEPTPQPTRVVDTAARTPEPERVVEEESGITTFRLIALMVFAAGAGGLAVSLIALRGVRRLPGGAAAAPRRADEAVERPPEAAAEEPRRAGRVAPKRVNPEPLGLEPAASRSAAPTAPKPMAPTPIPTARAAPETRRSEPSPPAPAIVSTAPRPANEGLDQGQRAAVLRLVALVLVTSAALLAFATDWDSPIRVGLVLSFMLFVPGLVVAELLEIRDPMLQLATAVAASLAVETLIGVALVYAGLFSAGLAFSIVVGITVAAVAAAGIRVRYSWVSVIDSESVRSSA